MKPMNVDLRINGDPVSLEVKPYETLLETLRNRMELTGAKEGCGFEHVVVAQYWWMGSRPGRASP